MFKKNYSPKKLFSVKIKTTLFTGLLVLTLGVVFLFIASPVLAQVNTGLEFGANTGLANTDPRVVAAKVIRIVLSFLGIVAVGLVIFAGFLWMTSGGDEEKVRKAKKILINAVIGLAIILSAWGITTFIIGRLTNSFGGGPGGPGGGGGVGGGGGALGGGILESHYPARDARGVPRDTNIFVNFKEVMKEDTLITDSGQKDGNNNPIYYLNDSNIKIYRTDEGIDKSLAASQVYAYKTQDGKTFIFDPIDNLGSADEPIWYTVYLGNGIQTVKGQTAFGINGYDWNFEVSTKLDLESPYVKNVIPIYKDYEGKLTTGQGFSSFVNCVKKECGVDDLANCQDKNLGDARTKCGAWPMNTTVQINFSEAIDPRVIDPAYNSLKVYNFGPDPSNPVNMKFTEVAGKFVITNEYKTVEFVTDNFCGINSCGGEVYCLPANADLLGLVRAASLMPCVESLDCVKQYGNDYECAKTLGNPAKSACRRKDDQKKYYSKAYPASLDGVIDAANNSLDGNTPSGALDGSGGDEGSPYNFGGDKKPQGSSEALGIDDFYWYFFSNDTIDLTAPIIEKVDPEPAAKGINLKKTIDILFSKLMMKSSFKPDCGYFDDKGKELCYITLNEGGFWLNSYDEDVDGVKGITIHDKTHVEISHAKFEANTEYNVKVSSEVKDIFQNCYQPCDGPSIPGSYCMSAVDPEGYVCCYGNNFDDTPDCFPHYESSGNKNNETGATAD